MARPVRAMLPSIILVVVLLFHVADSSRPLSTEEQQRPRADPTGPAAVVHRAELHHHRDAAETGNGRVAVETRTEDDNGSRTSSTRAEEGGAAAAALSSSATTTTPVAVGGQQQQDDGVGRSRNGMPAAAVQVLLRSRLARRFLVAAGVVEGADSAAKPSCGSSDVHNGCTPPSEH